MRPLDLPAAGAGRALATLTTAFGALRRLDKPLHPHGTVHPGVLVRTGSDTPTGVPWLDGAGEDPVVVRLSRSIGLPPTLPDIHGLALRCPIGGGHVDLLFATTGLGRVGRHLLVPRVDAARPMSTLLPYRTAAGPVVLGARPAGPERLALAWAAVGADAWHTFAHLELHAGAADRLISFDPLLNAAPGLEPYPWVVRLREPAYAWARARRSAGRPGRPGSPPSSGGGSSAGAAGRRPGGGAARQ